MNTPFPQNNNEKVKEELKQIWIEAIHSPAKLSSVSPTYNMFVSIAVDTMYYRHENLGYALSLKNVEDLYQFVSLNNLYEHSTTPIHIKEQIQTYFKTLSSGFKDKVRNSLVAEMDESHDLSIVRTYMCQHVIEKSLPIIIEKNQLNQLDWPEQNEQKKEKTGFKL